jgi:hypothetical protein
MAGNVVRTFDGYGCASSVNAAGHVLGTFGKGTGVWRTADDFQAVTINGSVLTDSGEVCGTRYDEANKTHAVRLWCD